MKNSLQNVLGNDPNQNWDLIGLNSGLIPPTKNSVDSTLTSSQVRNSLFVQWPEQQHHIVVSFLHAHSLVYVLIPERMRSWALDISERMQIPPEAIIAPALVAFSCVVGRKIGIQPKCRDDLLIVPNLWGGLVAPAGFLKSAAISEAFLPLRRLKRCSDADRSLADAQHLITQARLEDTKALIKTVTRRGNIVTIDQLKTQIEELVRDAEVNKSIIRPYDTSSSKHKNVTRLIHESPNGLLIIKGHLDNWLRRLSKPKHEDEREMLLNLGNVYRQISGNAENSGSAPAYVFGELGANSLQKYLKNAGRKKRDISVLQRIQILLYPDSYAPLPAIDKRPNYVARENIFDLFHMIDSVAHAKEGVIPAVRFSDEAQEIFDQWAYELKIRVKNAESKNDLLSTHLANYYSLMPSLALLFSVLERPKNIHGWNSVSASATNLAVRWCMFLEQHAKKAYNVGFVTQASAVKKIAHHIEAGSVMHGSTLKSICRQHDRFLSAPELVRQAIEKLEDFGWLRIIASDGAKRISLHPKFQSNPNALRFQALCNLGSLKETH